MKSWTTACALMLLCVAGAAARQEALSTELTALQGSCNMVSVNGQVAESGTIELDATKEPITVEFPILEGDDAGTLQLGILEIRDDTLTFAMNRPGATDRPTTFEAGGSGAVFVMKKMN